MWGSKFKSKETVVKKGNDNPVKEWIPINPTEKIDSDKKPINNLSDLYGENETELKKIIDLGIGGEKAVQAAKELALALQMYQLGAFSLAETSIRMWHEKYKDEAWLSLNILSLIQQTLSLASSNTFSPATSHNKNKFLTPDLIKNLYQAVISLLPVQPTRTSKTQSLGSSSQGSYGGYGWDDYSGYQSSSSRSSDSDERSSSYGDDTSFQTLNGWFPDFGSSKGLSPVEQFTMAEEVGREFGLSKNQIWDLYGHTKADDDVWDTRWRAGRMQDDDD